MNLIANFFKFYLSSLYIPLPLPDVKQFFITQPKIIIAGTWIIALIAVLRLSGLVQHRRVPIPRHFVTI